MGASDRKKMGEEAPETLLERKIREYWLIRIPGRDPNGVMALLILSVVNCNIKLNTGS